MSSTCLIVFTRNKTSDRFSVNGIFYFVPFALFTMIYGTTPKYVRTIGSKPFCVPNYCDIYPNFIVTLRCQHRLGYASKTLEGFRRTELEKLGMNPMPSNVYLEN